jgi:L-ascorbate metabolism protein UlaG (beta-lactamase superfamily)
MAFPKRLRRLGQVGLGGAILLFAVTVSTTNGCATFGSFSMASRSQRMGQNPGYRDGTFHNHVETSVMQAGALDAAREWWSGRQEREPKVPLPLYANTVTDLGTPPSTGLRITWMGHSTTLVELDGARILTDPHWSKRASPSSAVGPHRFHPPVMELEKLGKLDAVVISHDHYDHLDMETVQRLAATGTRFFVGLGVGTHFEKWGIPANQVTELEWWQEVTLTNGVRLISTPARHFSGRFLFRNNTLWTSWSMVGPQHRVYFSGDTGMGPDMAEIGEKLGPFDVTMLEIGQYHPSWGDIHLGPAGALEAHKALRGRTLLPVHWCTFELGLHGWAEPAEDLFNLAPGVFVDLMTPMLGQPAEPGATAPRTPWWRTVGGR